MQFTLPTKMIHFIGCLTFPDPEQFGHLSVLGADKGWSPLLTVETSVRTSAPVLEHRAQARYPAYIRSNVNQIHQVPYPTLHNKNNIYIEITVEPF